MSPSDILRKDAVLEKLEWNEKSNRFIRETLDISRRYMEEENPFLPVSYTPLDVYKRQPRHFH